MTYRITKSGLLFGTVRCVVCHERQADREPAADVIRVTIEGDPVHTLCLDEYIDSGMARAKREAREADREAARAPLCSVRAYQVDQ